MKSVKIANVVVASFTDLSNLSTADMLAFYNAATGKSTSKFASRAAGQMQVWALVEQIKNGTLVFEGHPDQLPTVKETVKEVKAEPTPKEVPAPKEKEVPAPAPKKAEPKAKKEAAVRKPRGFRFKFQASKEIKTVKPGSKRATLLELLSAEGGATFEECMAATGWGRKDCYEAIRLLHYYVGYGIDQNATTGKIWLLS